jgi:hypothetical protein
LYAVLSFELRSFAMLARLWDTGGVTSDFTLLLLRSIDARGFSHQPFKTRKHGGEGALRNDNAANSVMERSLHRFNSESLTTSSNSGGSSGGGGSDGDEYGDDFFACFDRHDPVLRCILSEYDSNVHVLCDRICLVNRVRKCADSLQVEVAEGEEAKEGAFRLDLVNWLEDDEVAVRDPTTPPLRWLGIHSHSGRWMETPHGDINNIPPLLRWSDTIRKCSPQQLQFISDTCSTFKPLEDAKDPKLRFGHVVESGVFGVPSFSQSPNEDEEDLEAANYRCSPQLIIPGAMKAASTYLFNVLASHPQVVKHTRSYK